jgi:hypothetical protein
VLCSRVGAGCLLSLRVLLLHIFELVQTRAQDVVRDPTEDRRKHKKDGDAAVDASQVTNNLLRGIRLLRHGHQRRRGQTRQTGDDPFSLRVLLLHVFELVQTRAQDVVRDPTEDRRKHKEDGDSAIDASQVTNDLLRGIRAFRLHHQRRSQSTTNRPSNDTLSLRVLLLHVFELVQTRAQDVVRDPTEDRRKHKEDGDSAIDTRQVTNNFLRLCGKRRLRETERGRRGRNSRRFDNLRFRGLRLIVKEKMREKSQFLIRVWVKIRAISFPRILFFGSAFCDGYRPFSSR